MKKLFDIFKRHNRARLVIKMYREQRIDPYTIIETAEEIFGVKEAEKILTTAQNYWE